MSDFRVYSEVEAAHRIAHQPGNAKKFVPWLGAGASREAGIPLANEIIERIAETRLRIAEAEGTSPINVRGEERRKLKLELVSRGNFDPVFSDVIELGYPSLADRVDFFRDLIQGHKPTFVHYALASMMHYGPFVNTCITTNFDKLIEHAFVEVGGLDCLPIRTERESNFYRPTTER